MRRDFALALLLAASVGGGGCASRAPRVAVAPPAGELGAWSYEVLAEDGGHVLDVEATFAPGTGTTLATLAESARFVRDVSVAPASAASSWRALAMEGDVWHAPACAAGCRVRYRFALAEAASSLDDVDLAASFEGALESPPSTWLLRPTEAPDETPYRMHVRVLGSSDSTFATGVRAIPDAPDTYGATSGDLEMAPYTVFGEARTRTLTAAGATIDLAMLHGPTALDDADVDRWVALSAQAVDAFYGRFPVPRVLVIVAPSHGEGAFGKTVAGGGASIVLEVGDSMAKDDVPRDWVLTHEMTHLAFPSIPREYRWLEEGLATYVEPIARDRVGTLDSREVWRGLVDGLPKGEPRVGDRGLDRTHTWGRTYWGGAMFCLVADMEIREQTGNAKSLEDALRGILAAGGNGEARWSIDRALAAGDKATGTHVLEELHARLGEEPVRVDLKRVWNELGVRVDGASVAFDDAAPGAAIRKGITPR